MEKNYTIHSSRSFIVLLGLLFNFLQAGAQSAVQIQQPPVLSELAPTWKEPLETILNQINLGVNTCTKMTKGEYRAFQVHYGDILFEDRKEIYAAVKNGSVNNTNAQVYINEHVTKYVALYHELKSQKSQSPYMASALALTAADSDAIYDSIRPDPGVCQPACTNIGFEDGTLNGWIACSAFNLVSHSTPLPWGRNVGYFNFNAATYKKNQYADCYGPGGSLTMAANAGKILAGVTYPDSYEDSVTTTGNDLYAGALVPAVCPSGGKHSVRVGDSWNSDGCGMGILEQKFMVTQANAAFTYFYTAFLEDPGHGYGAEPYFRATMFNQDGDTIQCGSYFVDADNKAGFQAVKGNNVGYPGWTIYVKPWTCVYVPLTKYIGQCVTVQFISSDCDQGAHAGWAYVDAVCNTMEVKETGTCKSKTLTASVLCGAKYKWLGPCISGLDDGPSITVTCSGIYKLILSSLKGGCSDTLIDTVKLSISSLTMAINKTDVKCKGDKTGSAAVTLGGSLTDYTYSWTPGGNTTTSLSGLGAGTYSCKISSKSGCGDSTLSVTITEPPALSNVKTSTPATCGKSDGSAGVTESGGVSPYTYSWNTGQTITNLSNIKSGTYTLNIKDANGCTDVSVVNVAGSNAFTATPSSTNVKCFGGNDGTADVTAAGGITPYIYKWSNGQTTSSASGLTAGTYTCVVNDQGGVCADSIIVVITQPTKLLMSSSVVNATCPGSCDGKAKTVASGGTTSYTYSWSNSATADSTKGLCAGNYTITITDKNSCTHDTTIKITEPSKITFVKNVNPSTCGKTDGSAAVTTSGGTSPYTFLWNTGATTSAISNIAHGSYTFIAKDAHGCKDSIVVLVPGGSAFDDFSTSANVKCFGGNDGSASVTVISGSSPYTYSWSTGETVSSVTGLKAGKYKVVVNDQTGICGDTMTITITQPTPLQLKTTSVDPICFGDCNGKAKVTGSGATPPYVYSWSNAATTDSISSLCAASYTISLTDKNSCKHDTTITLTQPTPLSFVKSATPTTCGAVNGKASVTASGGTSPYTYTWKNNPTSVPNLSNIPSGTYTLTVTDSKGCHDTVSVFVPNNTPFTLGTAPAKLLCFGDKTGSLTATATGTSSPFTYSWSNGDLTNSISNLPAGKYTVTVTDKDGCKTTKTDSVTQPPALTLTTTGQTICNGESATLAATAGGGTSPYTYVWDNTNTGISYAVTPAVTTKYTQVTTDANGCIITAKDSVIVIPMPKALFSGIDVCVGIPSTFKDSSLANGGDIGSWQWNFGDGTSTNVQNPSHTYTKAGTYTVSLTVMIGGCQSTITHVVNVYPVPIADFAASPQPTTILNTTITMTDLSTGGVKGSWDFGDGNTDLYSPGVNPVHTYPNENIPGGESFRIKLDIVNQYGCPDTISKMIYIDPEWTFYVPNTITPNGDGRNDIFFGTGIGIIEKEMWIFDRWGNLIFHTNDLYGGWDGKVQAGNEANVSTLSNEVAQEDTYVWLIVIKEVFMKTHRYIGHVNIIR